RGARFQRSVMIDHGPMARGDEPWLALSSSSVTGVAPAGTAANAQPSALGHRRLALPPASPSRPTGPRGPGNPCAETKCRASAVNYRVDFGPPHHDRVADR